LICLMHFADILAVYSLAELFEHTTSVLLISSFLEFSCLTYQCDVNVLFCASGSPLSVSCAWQQVSERKGWGRGVLVDFAMLSAES